jgi:hypothetical protein
LLVQGKERGQRTDKSLVEILTDAGEVVVGPGGKEAKRKDQS